MGFVGYLYIQQDIKLSCIVCARARYYGSSTGSFSKTVPFLDWDTGSRTALPMYPLSRTWIWPCCAVMDLPGAHCCALPWLHHWPDPELRSCQFGLRAVPSAQICALLFDPFCRSQPCLGYWVGTLAALALPCLLCYPVSLSLPWGAAAHPHLLMALTLYICTNPAGYEDSGFQMCHKDWIHSCILHSY